MGRCPLSADQIDRIRDCWRQNWSPQRVADEEGVSLSAVLRNCRGIERPPCGCGRPASHKGHCLARAATNPRVAAARANIIESREVWTDAVDEILRSTYPSGVEIDAISTAVSLLTGFYVSTVAIASRVARLDLHRPAWFMSRMATTGKVGWAHHPQSGRPPGKRPGPVLLPGEAEQRLKDRRTHRAAQQRARTARITANRLTAEACDRIFALMVVDDMLEIERLARLPIEPPALASPPEPPPPEPPPPEPLLPEPSSRLERGLAALLPKKEDFTPPELAVATTDEDVAETIPRWTPPKPWEGSALILLPATRCQTVTNSGRFGVGITFCDKPSEKDRSWCEECCKRYFVKSEPRLSYTHM
jgi:hypothetical protein